VLVVVRHLKADDLVIGDLVLRDDLEGCFPHLIARPYALGGSRFVSRALCPSGGIGADGPFDADFTAR
jgi:hypothetical protein